MDMLERTPEFLAARLALLALRASIDVSTPLDADRVLLGPSASPMSTEAAAQLLAAKPKPLFCDAEARDGVLVIRCRILSEASALESQSFETTRRENEKRGGLMGYLEDHYGPGDHFVAAFGRDESILVPHSVVERWSREYQILGSFSGDDVANPLAQQDAAYLDARSRGAKGVLRFGSSENIYSELIVTEIALPLDSLASESERREAEEQLIDMARMCHKILPSIVVASNRPASPTTASKWRRWQQERIVSERIQFTELAQLLKHAFSGREMPPEVAAFVEDCDNHLS